MHVIVRDGHIWNDVDVEAKVMRFSYLSRSFSEDKFKDFSVWVGLRDLDGYDDETICLVIPKNQLPTEREELRLGCALEKTWIRSKINKVTWNSGLERNVEVENES